VSELGLSFADIWEDYYKIAGFTIFFSFDLTVNRRSTDTYMESLAMVGGLDYICGIVITLVFSYFFRMFARAEYMSRLYYDKKGNGYKNQILSQVQNLIDQKSTKFNDD